MDLITQVTLTFSLIIGALFAEILTTKIFGFVKKTWFLLIEALIFVITTILLLNSLYIQNLEVVKLIFLYFACGFIAIILSRGLTSLLGFFSIKIEEKIEKRKFDQETIMIGLIRNLARRGLKKEEIKSILKNSGFEKEKIEKVFKNIKIEPNLRIRKK
jgi:hypothetical protein